MSKNKLNDGSLLGTLHDEDYSKLKEDIEGVIASKIYRKIDEKKKEVLSRIREI